MYYVASRSRSATSEAFAYSAAYTRGPDVAYLRLPQALEMDPSRPGTHVAHTPECWQDSALTATKFADEADAAAAALRHDQDFAYVVGPL